MELRHLRYYVAVAEELSFTRAAERLYIAQPPLSTQIRLLEEELKVQLFERDKRRVFLTQAGRHLLESARAILAAVDSATHEARSAGSGEIGKLALGYTATSMLAVTLPEVLRTFRQAHPQVNMSLREMSSLAQLDGVHGRSLDLAVLRRPAVTLPAGLVIEEWYQSPLVAAVPKDHPLAAAAAIRMSDLRDQPLITYPRDSGIGLYWKVHELCAKAGFRPRLAQEARDSSTIIGLVAAGVGIAVVPSDTRCIQLAGVVYQRIADRDAASTLHLAYREANDNAYVMLLLRALRRARRR